MFSRMSAFVFLSLVLPAIALAQNAIVVENQQTGSPPSEWDISGAGDDNIQGYATDISVDQGETVYFKVKTDATDYRLDIYRLGYYNGNGARKVDTIQPSAGLPQIQPDCGFEAATNFLDCGNWDVSASWDVPAGAVSGVYFAKLVREDGTPGESHIVFIVRDDDGGSALLFQTSDTTWQAYNRWGENGVSSGYSLYEPTGDKADKVSYNRPFGTRDYPIEDWVFNAEYPMIRWIERNGYDVSYFTNVDTDRYGAEIQEHAVFMSVGHDEYWSRAMRENVTAARDAGVHLAFFSGNEVYWKVRWEDSTNDPVGNARTLVCYKWPDRTRDPLYGIDNSRVTVMYAVRPVFWPENTTTGVGFRNGGYMNKEGTGTVGQYTVYRTDHWAFAGTGLHDGDRFEYETELAIEVDGALFEWQGGLPVVTGERCTASFKRMYGFLLNSHQ